jgi:hypothetical protein
MPFPKAIDGGVIMVTHLVSIPCNAPAEVISHLWLGVLLDNAVAEATQAYRGRLAEAIQSDDKRCAPLWFDVHPRLLLSHSQSRAPCCRRSQMSGQSLNPRGI